MWKVKQGVILYNNACWECVWDGDNICPDGPYGKMIPVFNTTYDKAKKCADTFNSYLKGN